MLRRFLLRLMTFFRHSHAEAELARELEAHLQLLEDRFVAQGMERAEAYRAARRAFGGQIELVKERQRDTRSFRWMDQSWLDVKLAVRMLIRYPGLTVVGVLGMAVAIAIGSGVFAVVGVLLNTRVPLDDGERVVSIQYWDAARNTAERRVAHDFHNWRSALTSVEHLAAFRDAGRNLIVPGATPQVVRVAEMTASGFAVARVAPILGRYLVDADERAGAAPVVVIGHAEWRTRFAGDPAVVGRSVQLGATHFTIVGVMPEGFAFPVNHHFWVPLAVDALAQERPQEAELMVFGRLAPGATRASAQSQFAAFTDRINAETPTGRRQLRAQVVPYTFAFSDMGEPENALTLRVLQFAVALLLTLVAINVAILVYARTVTRHAEIAVRSALGASRRRIVAQLSLEALALALLSAVLALGIVAVGFYELRTALLPILGEFPFWLEFRLTPGAVLYALVLAVVAAAIAGVVPALKATGRSLHYGLQGISPGAGSGARLGTTWTMLIVAQVAVAVALLPATVYQAWDAVRHRAEGQVSPGEQFLRAQVLMDRPAGAEAASSSTFTQRFGARVDALLQQLRSEPQVIDATFALSAPGEERAVWLAVDGVQTPTKPADYSVAAGSAAGHQVGLNHIDPSWLDVFDVRLLGGRRLSAADAGASAVIVNQSFVQRILGGGNALGQRLRYVGVSGDARAEDVRLDEWFEIVGVIEDFPAAGGDRQTPRVYHAATPAQLYPVMLAVHVRGREAASFANRLREVTAAIDPALQLRGVDRIDAPALHDRLIFRLLASGLVLITLSVVVLCAAGIYALMSCAVEQRRKEIGIRTALGADPRRLLGAIFARAVAQLGTGAALGICIALLLEILAEGDTMGGRGGVVLPLIAVFMVIVGVAAAFGPARRGLRVHPTAALRAD